ncbi:MAG: hypothetical protein HUK02_07085 [Bacteroidaceae bacterium]|nr:hypothetical protein [Bacteroidaceae bacterium]
MQDFSNTCPDGALDTKVAEMTRLLDYSTTHVPTTATQVPWVFNFCSAYTAGGMGSISTSTGYCKNAAVTNKAMAAYLENHTGPTGIVLMDYACVDDFDGMAPMGKTLVEAIIANNWKYIRDGETFTIPAEGVATFCPTQWAVDLPEGVEFFSARAKVPYEGSELRLLWFTPVVQTQLAKGEGVLVCGPAGDYTAYRTLDAVAKIEDNVLVGTTGKTYVASGRGWWLQYPDGEPAFCAMKGATYPAGTVYLKANSGQTPEGFAYDGSWTEAPALPILFSEPEYDGVLSPVVNDKSARIYNIMGQSVSAPNRPGLYIRQGRLFVKP